MHAHTAVASVQARSHLPVFGSIAFDVRIQKKQLTTTHFHAPYLSVDWTMAGIDLHHHGSAVLANGCFHRQLIDVGLEILFMLPAIGVKALAKISLPIKQTNSDERNPEIGSALDMIAGQNSKSSGVDGQRFVNAKFSGEIGYRTGPQYTGVAGAPGALRILILAQATIRIVDTAVQNKFRGPRFEVSQRILVQQGDGTVIELPPTQRIEIAKQGRRIVIPAPPHVTRQSPKTSLRWSYETIERAGFAHDGRNSLRRLRELANFVCRKDSRLQGLNDQNPLQHAAIDNGNSEKRLVIVLACLAEVLETMMILDLFDGHRTNLFRNQAGESFIHCHAQLADAFTAQSESSR